MRCERFATENYDLFAVGTLNGVERDEIQGHLDLGCETCRAELVKSRAVWYAVASTTPLVEPSRHLRKSVLSSIRPQETGSRPLAVNSWWPWATAATFGLALLGFGLYRNLNTASPAPLVAYLESPATSALREQNRVLQQGAKPVVVTVPVLPPTIAVKDLTPQLLALRADLARASSEAADERIKSAKLDAALAQQRVLVANAERAAQEADRKYSAALQQRATPDESQKQLALASQRAQQLEREVAQYKLLLAAEKKRTSGNLQLANLLGDPALKLVRLRPTEKGAGVEGHAFVSAGSQVIFFASHLPALPANRTYQLWLLRSRGPAVVSAGIFDPDDEKRGSLTFTQGALTSDVTAIAVTDEPTGGSEKPTGHKLLIGS